MGAMNLVIQDLEHEHRMAHLPIHTYLVQLAPYLEQRQQVAKRLQQAHGASIACKSEHKELIAYLNKEMMKMLGIVENPIPS